MPIYRNIDGTSNQSFKIGLKGVELSTHTTFADGENSEKIKELLVDGKAVVTEDKIVVSRSVVSGWQNPTESGICTFVCKYYDDEGTLKVKTIKLRTADFQEESNDITIEGSPNNIPIFDETGTALKDSGYKILSSILNSNEMEDEKAIPTVAAVKAYVGKVEEPLNQRTQGYNAKILDK